MSWQTDQLTGKRNQPVPAAPAPVPADTGGRSFGFRSGAANPAITPHETEAVAAGAALGEPTSFRGGAGAPMPVEVVRGVRTTFTNPAPEAPGGGYNPTPSRNTAEFATPLQAQQAWNRGMRGGFVAEHPTRGNLTYPEGTSPEEQANAKYGSFRTPGQTLQETPAREIPGHVEAWKEQAKLAKAQTGVVEAGQAKVDKAKVGTDFDTLMHESPYSTFDTGKGKTEFKAKDESQYRDYLASRNLALAQGDPAVGRKHFEDRQMVRQWLNTQENKPDFNADAALDAATQNPEHWQGLVGEAKRALGVSRPPVKRSFWDNFRSGPAPAANPKNAWATPYAPSLPAPTGEPSVSEKVPEF